MGGMKKLQQAIVVEGRYDRMRVSALFDCPVLETGGFNLMRDKKTQQLICRFAETTGIVLLTDSDPAGQQIRAFVNQLAKNGVVCNAYIPQLAGKEHRKAHPGAAGLLGVEGVPDQLIERAVLDSLHQAPGVRRESAPAEPPITAAELFQAGLTGCPDSAARRADFLRTLALPGDLPVKQMLRCLNAHPGAAQTRRLLQQWTREHLPT